MKKAVVKLVVFLMVWFALDWGAAAFIQRGLERYYGLDQEADILLIGHSFLMKSCHKEALEHELNCKVSKYCREGVMVRDRYSMVQHFLDSQKDASVPFVLYGVDLFMFQEGDLSFNSYKLFYPFMDSPSMDLLVREKAGSWYDYPLHKYIRSTRFTENMIYRSLRGWVGYWKSLDDGTLADERWREVPHWGVYMPEETVAVFQKTLQLLEESGCHVVLVMPPVIEAYQKANPEAYEQMVAYYQQLADSSPHIDFLNYCPLLSHRKEVFRDPVHLNSHGGNIMTDALIQDLKKLMNK